VSYTLHGVYAKTHPAEAAPVSSKWVQPDPDGIILEMPAQGSVGLPEADMRAVVDCLGDVYSRRQ